ncbi:DUF4328 domain-containing protein [Nocardia sp. NPDC088792]|uniref:DUF4328 domain-containing protein n=1 Tax=Nocardia sp. NPDC088792 TaxID=3364332 RepID=UPI003810E1E7
MAGGRDSRTTVVQPCARCGARWAVQNKPLHWCPRCHGVLLSPAPVDAPPQRRNYRWVARPPGRRTADRNGARPQPDPGTPRYTQMPRWGLQDRPPVEAPAPRRPLAPLTTRVPRLLIATAVMFGLAALAEFGRYGVLLYNRSRLVQPAVLWTSDVSVIITSALSLALALVTAVALVGWLAETRKGAYAAAGEEDPRSLRLLVLGCVVPVVNLVWPGVFLTEIVRVGERAAARRAAMGKRRVAASGSPAAGSAGATGDYALLGDPRLLRAVRIWWAVWVLNAVLVVIASLFRLTNTLQAQANGVEVTILTNLVAAGVAVLSLALVRAFAGLDLRGHPRVVHRWLMSTGPARPVIEPVHAGAARSESGSTGRAPAAAVGNDELTAPIPDDGPAVTDGAPQAEQEEVLAK